MDKGFTLLELIIVIIIIGILATLGLSSYTNQVEYARTAEVKAQVGAMSKLTYDYYLKNNTLTGLQNSDVGVDNTCSTDKFFRYTILFTAADRVWLGGYRCSSGGKSPNTSRVYSFYRYYYPAADTKRWSCVYEDDYSPCFGLGRTE